VREIFEHTADAGIRAESSTLSEAFHEVSLAFTEIITGGSLPDTKNNFEINIESSSLDSLLVNYISHLIYLFDTENFLVSSVEVSIKSGLSNTVSGILKGDFYNEAIHGYGVEIKAVSYHMLEISEGPPSKIVVILDL
jgi:SHS2 domain-containing protein|tara:strand:- start:102 stop:515 length:414 start_codon:yes stop_codon:yes gene_type:complete